MLISGIAQFQLVHIHPFLDGNGRTSRLLSTLCLYRAEYDFKRLFIISEYYDRDRPTFDKSIQSVRENGMDMTTWLDYFITGLETQMILNHKAAIEMLIEEADKVGFDSFTFLNLHAKLCTQSADLTPDGRVS